MAGHIDAHLDSKLPCSRLSIEKMTRETKLGTSRTNVFRERMAGNVEGDLAFNWHYDRTLFGGLVKDLYLMDGKMVDD